MSLNNSTLLQHIRSANLIVFLCLALGACTADAAVTSPIANPTEESWLPTHTGPTQFAQSETALPSPQPTHTQIPKIPTATLSPLEATAGLEKGEVVEFSRNIQDLIAVDDAVGLAGYIKFPIAHCSGEVAEGIQTEAEFVERYSKIVDKKTADMILAGSANERSASWAGISTPGFSFGPFCNDIDCQSQSNYIWKIGDYCSFRADYFRVDGRSPTAAPSITNFNFRFGAYVLSGYEYFFAGLADRNTTFQRMLGKEELIFETDYFRIEHSDGTSGVRCSSPEYELGRDGEPRGRAPSFRPTSLGRLMVICFDRLLVSYDVLDQNHIGQYWEGFFFTYELRPPE